MKDYETAVKDVAENIAYNLHHRRLHGIKSTQGTGVSGAAIAIGELYDRDPMKVREDLRDWTRVWFRAITLEYQIKKKYGSNS